MALRTIAILSPGDMGHGIGAALGRSGFDVITCLAGRSARTHQLAQRGGFRVVSTLDELVVEADIVLSILVPAQAERVAQAVYRRLQGSQIRRLCLRQRHRMRPIPEDMQQQVDRVAHVEPGVAVDVAVAVGLDAASCVDLQHDRDASHDEPRDDTDE